MSGANITEALVNTCLDWAYETAVQGMGGLEPASAIAEGHHRTVQTSFQMAEEIVAWQLGRATITGYFDNLWKDLVVPDAIPKELGTFFFLQMRVAGAIAYGGGHDLNDPRIRALVFSTFLCDAQAQALESVELPADFVAKRSTLKAVPQTIAAPLENYSRRALWKQIQEANEPIAAILTNPLSAWSDGAFAKALGATASRTFLVLHTW